jgi:hypothetical protein
MFDNGPIDNTVFGVLCLIAVVGIGDFVRRLRRPKGK